MTTLLFVRHGAHDLLGGTLAGTTKKVHLNANGERQAAWLAERLANFRVDAIVSSPLVRCVETASVIAQRLGLPVERVEAANEVEFGDWSGKEFAQLTPLPAWARFNTLRSMTSPPGGEYMVGVQARMLSLVEILCRQFPEGCVVIVSHADVIKAALAYFLGVPIDLFHRIEISPGSLTRVALDETGPRILSMNEVLSI